MQAHIIIQAALDLPNVSMSPQLSDPQITAHKVSSRISGMGCSFFLSMRGSSSCPKISKKSISSSSLIIDYPVIIPNLVGLAVIFNEVTLPCFPWPLAKLVKVV
jgi:hypothetical protein